ncbi:MAG: hypothetical protein AAGA05_09110 [Pseudomonadota bacterium]
MKRIRMALTLIAALTLVLTTTANARPTHTGAKPPENYEGQWYTTATGCTYSRAKAPGYPTSWHLVLNPHHLGKPPAHRRCASML